MIIWNPFRGLEPNGRAKEHHKVLLGEEGDCIGHHDV